MATELNVLYVERTEQNQIKISCNGETYLSQPFSDTAVLDMAIQVYNIYDTLDEFFPDFEMPEGVTTINIEGNVYPIQDIDANYEGPDGL